jgi:hypothetical protein
MLLLFLNIRLVIEEEAALDLSLLS